MSNNWHFLSLDQPERLSSPSIEEAQRLIAQLDGLVSCGNTVIVVEHDMRVVADSDWIIDIGPGAASARGNGLARLSPGILVPLLPADVERQLGCRLAESEVAEADFPNAFERPMQGASSSKNVDASLTVIANTSAMVLS